MKHTTTTFHVEKIDIQNARSPSGRNLSAVPRGRTAGGAALPLLSAWAAGMGTQLWQSWAQGCKQQIQNWVSDWSHAFSITIYLTSYPWRHSFCYPWPRQGLWALDSPLSMMLKEGRGRLPGGTCLFCDRLKACFQQPNKYQRTGVFFLSANL